MSSSSTATRSNQGSCIRTFTNFRSSNSDTSNHVANITVHFVHTRALPGPVSRLVTRVTYQFCFGTSVQPLLLEARTTLRHRRSYATKTQFLLRRMSIPNTLNRLMNHC